MILARSASVNLVAPSPYMTASRSPGSKRITTKMMIDTPKTVRTPKGRASYQVLVHSRDSGAPPRFQYGDRSDRGNCNVCVQLIEEEIILEPHSKPVKHKRQGFLEQDRVHLLLV